MLSADQIDVLGVKAEQLMDPVINLLIEDIARRVAEAGQLTSTAAYQVWRAQNLGLSQKEIKKKVQKLLKVSQKELEQLFTQAANVGYNFDLSNLPTDAAIPFAANEGLQQIVSAAVELAQEDLSNIVQTIGFVGSDGKARPLTKAYQQACDTAFSQVATGATDYMSAIRNATKNLADKGIRYIDYESGVHTSMEAAVRRNVMGGLGLMQEEISQHNHDSLGCNGWEISAHAASAPDHEPIQGKQYPDAEFHRLNNSLQRRIRTLGCGHDAFPIILGVNRPQYTPEELEELRESNEKGVTYEGKHYTLYKATQRQRKLERSIRTQKRRILADGFLGDKDKLQIDQIKLVRYRDEYNRFSKSVGLPTQYNRMETAGFDWKKGKTAEKTAERVAREKAESAARELQHQKNLQFIKDDATIKASSGLPKKLENLPAEKLRHTVNVNIEPSSPGAFEFHAVAPIGAEMNQIEVQAGKGTSSPIRDLKRLYATYGRSPEGWQKKSGTAYGKRYHYVIHWYEHDGFIPVDEIKLKGMKKNK